MQEKAKLDKAIKLLAKRYREQHKVTVEVKKQVEKDFKKSK